MSILLRTPGSMKLFPDAVAKLKGRMNIQAPWGGAVSIAGRQYSFIAVFVNPSSWTNFYSKEL